MKKINVNNLKVDEQLLNFVNEEIIPGTNINTENFWSGFEKALNKLTPINKKLLEKRVKWVKEPMALCWKNFRKLDTIHQPVYWKRTSKNLLKRQRLSSKN